MGKRGPKPMPTALRVIEGNRGHRGMSPMEPKPQTDRPDAPPWLQPYALELWNRVIDELYMTGMLTLLDAETLGTVCECFGRYRLCVENVNRWEKANPNTGGIIVKTKNGNPIQNPLFGQLNTLRREWLKAAAEFGLSPSSRTQIDAGKSTENNPKARKYFA